MDQDQITNLNEKQNFLAKSLIPFLIRVVVSWIARMRVPYTREGEDIGRMTLTWLPPWRWYWNRKTWKAYFYHQWGFIGQRGPRTDGHGSYVDKPWRYLGFEWDWRWDE